MLSLFKKIAYLTIFLAVLTFIYAFQQPEFPKQEFPKDLLEERNKAEILLNQGAWDEATAIYQQLQQKCKDRGLGDLAIGLYEEIFSIIVYREDMELDNKRVLIDEYYANERDKELLGIYYGTMAHLYVFYGEIDSMNRYYTLATELYQEEDEPKSEVGLNAIIAQELYFLDDVSTALIFLEKAERLLEEKLKPKGLDFPMICNVQTGIYVELGDYEKALKSNLCSISLLEEDSSTSLDALASEYNNLATLYSYMKDYSNSINYYNKSINIMEAMPNISKFGIATIIYNLGSTYQDMGRYEDAKKAFKKSLLYLGKFKEGLDKEVVSDYINNYQQLSNAFIREENIDSAKYYLAKVQKINKTFSYRISVTYSDLGRVALLEKDYVKAEEYLLRSIEIATENYGPKNSATSVGYSYLHGIALDKLNHKKALFYSQKGIEAISLDFSDPNGVSNPKVENVLNKGTLINLLFHKLNVLKLLYKEENSTIEAADMFATAELATQCLEIINNTIKNRISKQRWLSSSAIPLFESAIFIAIEIYQKTGDENYLNKAFMLSERSKSMLMIGAMQEDNASSFGGVPDSLIEKSKTIKKSLDKAEKGRFDAKMAGEKELEKVQDDLIFQYKHDLDVLKHTFEDQYPKYFQLKYSSYTASIKELQDILDNETTLIEYFEGDEHIYAFAINKDKAQVEVIEKEDGYRNKMYLFQQAIMNIKGYTSNPIRTFNNFVENASAFYDKLLKDVLSEGRERLIIIPDGQLGYLPFEVLLTKPVELLKQTETEADFSKLPYLIREYKISYNYSGTLLISQQAAQKNVINGKILALAPSYAQGDVPEWRGGREAKLRKTLIELPGAVEEVNKLEVLFEGKFLVGAAANESIFKENAGQYGILHLAMHGLVDRMNPEFSGLALTEDSSKEQDNFLYAYEIKQMHLHAGLVVLSACETGIGKYQRGEGVVSLGREFMYAGAPALLMTLWSLNDQSGAILVEEFYKNISNGMEKDAAIRAAKLYYLDNIGSEYAHPFMWAAFIQVGDYSPIKIGGPRAWLWYGVGLIAIFIVLLGGIKMRTKQDA
jgi:CHAT domain-containing protein